ncbi:MAG TPA: hypothetical protein VEK79_07395 [Thermoanaerobaculia bacterium]|nr:hypothetical protein [Thermoanaerobaculia bacterium]
MMDRINDRRGELAAGVDAVVRPPFVPLGESPQRAYVPPIAGGAVVPGTVGLPLH